MRSNSDDSHVWPLNDPFMPRRRMVRFTSDLPCIRFPIGIRGPRSAIRPGE